MDGIEHGTTEPRNYTELRHSTQFATLYSFSMQAITDIRWGDYPPGMEQVTLRLEQGIVSMAVDQVSKPNQPHKPIGMLKASSHKPPWY